jgi:O-antigen/teichoic acid export membrane protein
MARLDDEGCGALTGGLYRDQRRLVAVLSGAALLLVLALFALGVVGGPTALLCAAAIAAVAAALRREYFRMVLLAYRRAPDVLRGDLAYAALLALGVVLALLTPWPALSAAGGLALAALAGSGLLQRALKRRARWDAHGMPGILREIAPLGAWSTAGAAIHWSFSQGYVYLVAATLDVGAVAALAATRLLAMPVNLLSVGIGSLLLPLAARWHHEHGAATVLRRLALLALALAALAIAYFATLWLLRDWVFDRVLHKHFAQRDLLLLLWSGGFVLMVVHQQLLFLLVVRERFRTLVKLALVTATVALGCGYLGMRHLGGAGAVLGIGIGEAVNTVGIALLCLREVLRAAPRERAPDASGAVPGGVAAGTSA